MILYHVETLQETFPDRSHPKEIVRGVTMVRPREDNRVEVEGCLERFIAYHRYIAGMRSLLVYRRFEVK